jgi:serine/threonine protein phosphatase PrpC
MLRLLTPATDPLEDMAIRLIDAANAAGGKDNITVVLIRYTE